MQQFATLIFSFIDERISVLTKIISAFKCTLAPNVAVKVAVTKHFVAVKGPHSPSGRGFGLKWQ